MLLENDTIIKDWNSVAEIFNEFFVNIVEHITGKKPTTFTFDPNLGEIEQIISHYETI